MWFAPTRSPFLQDKGWVGGTIPINLRRNIGAASSERQAAIALRFLLNVLNNGHVILVVAQVPLSYVNQLVGWDKEAISGLLHRPLFSAVTSRHRNITTGTEKIHHIVFACFAEPEGEFIDLYRILISNQ